MALWNILAGASGGLRQGLDDLRQRQLQDEQRQRQAAMDQMQQEQFGLQKQQFADNQAQRLLENQRWQQQWDASTQRSNASARVQGIQLAREGILSDKSALNQYYRDAGLPVEQATMQLSPLMQAITGINRDSLSTDRDYAAGQYGAVRNQQLADRQAEAKRLADQEAAARKFQLERDAATRKHDERMASLNARLQPSVTPSFTFFDNGKSWFAGDQRTGRVNDLGIHAQDKTKAMDSMEAARKDIQALIPSQTMQMAMMMPTGPIATSVRSQLRAIAARNGLPEATFDGAFASTTPGVPSVVSQMSPEDQMIQQYLQDFAKNYKKGN